MSRQRRWLAALLFVCCCVAGCSGSDAVGWANGYCGVLVDLGRSTGTPPKVDANQPKQSKAKLLAWVSAAASAIDTAATDLRGIGEAPDDSGVQAVHRLADVLAELKEAVVDAEVVVRAASPSNPNAFLRSYQDVIGRMATVAGDPFAGIPGSREIADAARHAKNCQVR